MLRDDEYEEHAAAMEWGAILNPPEFELLVSWTFVMHNFALRSMGN